MKKFDFRETYLNEGFFDDIEDDIFTDTVDNTLNTIWYDSINSEFKQLSAEYTDITKYHDNISNDEYLKYKRYLLFAKWYLDNEECVKRLKNNEDKIKCTIEIKLLDNYDIIEINTNPLRYYDCHITVLHIKDNKIIFADLSQQYFYVSDHDLSIMYIGEIVNMLKHTGFTNIESLTYDRLGKLGNNKKLDLRLFKNYWDNNENTKDVIEYLLKYPLPEIYIYDEIHKFSMANVSFNLNIILNPDILFPLCYNHLKNDYNIKQITDDQDEEQLTKYLIPWSIPNKNIIFNARSERNQQIFKNYLIDWIRKQYLISLGYRLGSISYNMKFDKKQIDKKFGLYYPCTINLNFKNDEKNKWTYIDLNINAYSSGKIDVINMKES